MLTRARQVANKKWKETKSFTVDPIYQIGILVYAFREKSEQYAASFWKDMTLAMIRDVKRSSMQDVYMKYSSNQVHVLENVLAFLAPPPKEEKK